MHANESLRTNVYAGKGGHDLWRERVKVEDDFSLASQFTYTRPACYEASHWQGGGRLLIT